MHKIEQRKNTALGKDTTPGRGARGRKSIPWVIMPRLGPEDEFH